MSKTNQIVFKPALHSVLVKPKNTEEFVTIIVEEKDYKTLRAYYDRLIKLDSTALNIEAELDAYIEQLLQNERGYRDGVCANT